MQQNQRAKRKPLIFSGLIGVGILYYLFTVLAPKDERFGVTPITKAGSPAKGDPADSPTRADSPAPVIGDTKVPVCTPVDPSRPALVCPTEGYHGLTNTNAVGKKCP